MVKLMGKPVLIEMWEERFFYFVLKWEFNFVDNLNKASALSTDQIDIEKRQALRHDVCGRKQRKTVSFGSSLFSKRSNRTGHICSARKKLTGTP